MHYYIFTDQYIILYTFKQPKSFYNETLCPLNYGVIYVCRIKMYTSFIYENIRKLQNVQTVECIYEH